MIYVWTQKYEIYYFAEKKSIEFHVEKYSFETCKNIIIIKISKILI